MESEEVIISRLKDLLKSTTSFDAFRSIHPDHNRHISARFLQMVFHPELNTKYQLSVPCVALEKAWQEEAAKWPRKRFQFFRRDARFTIVNPRNDTEIIKTSLGQANFLCWVIADPVRLQEVLQLANLHASVSDRTAPRKTTNKVECRTQKTPKLPKKAKVQPVIKQRVRVKRERKREVEKPSVPLAPTKPRREKPKKISDPLDEDIKPRLSSKNRSRQSPTYCTSNTAWAEMKQKNPNFQIKLVY